MKNNDIDIPVSLALGPTDLMFCDAVSTSGAATSQELTDGGGKAATLVISEEEKLLLAQEGIELPMDLPLTKAEQQQLKRVRRKIKNKVSAQESRKRKKEYVDGLEKRVEHCTTVNRKLQRKVSTLETENRSLLAQLRKLQAMVSEYNPSRMQAGSLLLVVILSFSLFFAPWLRTSSPSPGGGDYQSIRGEAIRAWITKLDCKCAPHGVSAQPLIECGFRCFLLYLWCNTGTVLRLASCTIGIGSAFNRCMPKAVSFCSNQ